MFLGLTVLGHRPYKSTAMLPRYLTMILTCLTFTLLLVGGVVHSTGSSLACPDWPLCYGQVFPPMRGGIFYEHSHRLLASAVGCVTVALAWSLRRESPRLRSLGFLGVALVIFQGLLGGMTVLLRLPPLISVAHLATSMAFFAWTVLMLLRVRIGTFSDQAPLISRRGIAWAASLVYLQIVLGALVRHSGASLSCGLEAVTCAGLLLPSSAPQLLQTAHRIMALVVTGAVIGSTITPMRWARRTRGTWVRRLAIFIHVTILLQLCIGVLTLKTGVQIHVVTTHLALGALLWAMLVALFVRLGTRRGTRHPAASDDAGVEWAVTAS